MRRMHRGCVFSAIALLALVQGNVGIAHEPIFGKGPRTIWKGGLGWQTQFEFDKAGVKEVLALEEELLYGITENWAVTLEIPWLDKTVGSGSSSGLGDSVLLTKYRFYRHDVPGGTYQAAVLGGLKLPTGDEDATPRLGTGSWDPIIGFAADYEGRRWLTFADVRYKFNTRHDGFERGDQLFYDLALGYRPWLTDYKEPDTVLMFELNGELEGRTDIRGGSLPDTGGDALFAGFGLWWTYRNLAIKPGIQIPIYQNLNGDQEEVDFRVVLAVELHF